MHEVWKIFKLVVCQLSSSDLNSPDFHISSWRAAFLASLLGFRGGGGSIFRFFSWLYVVGDVEEVHWFGCFPLVQLTSNDHYPGAKFERIMWDWAIRRSLLLRGGEGSSSQEAAGVGVGRNSPWPHARSASGTIQGNHQASGKNHCDWLKWRKR